MRNSRKSPVYLTKVALFRPVLAKVKEKTPILLPGWDASEVMIIEETPFTQATQGESQIPEASMLGVPSPVKPYGSFMNRVVSPNIKKSPMKPPPKSPGAARRKLPVTELKNEDFVVITPSTKRKRDRKSHV